ncbi:type II toxin-antitoxin system Phd/YefM family antitoxin [Actinomadura sp. 3N407]|uniref:type II toxin-antitoxin system Phd/YefM family antitoxin n=1 Tax=Actinomadura sp. 3N407 TaxID=3457423 RepID=UPI003FCDDAD3
MAKRMKSREVRDNWRDVLDHVRAGNEVVIEHYNKPIARIVPIKEPAMSEHFTAWLAMDTGSLYEPPFADVSVLRDELRGEADDPDAWAATGDERFRATTTVDAETGDDEDAIREARALLEADGWRLSGDWKAFDGGYTVTVERT